MSPEEKARQIIDKQLEDAGWVIQDRKELNPIASLGVAVREYPTSDNEEVDYALFIGGKPVVASVFTINQSVVKLSFSLANPERLIEIF